MQCCIGSTTQKVGWVGDRSGEKKLKELYKLSQ